MRTTSQRGFTLIELLIAVVIIGILAAVAIPNFKSSKEKAYLGTMRGDLRNLATAQESYIADAGTYYNGAVPAAVLVYSPSQGVTITITEGTDKGWAATASAIGTSRTCAIFYGTAAPPAPATADGVIACT